jgi:hypothetical protein
LCIRLLEPMASTKGAGFNTDIDFIATDP